MAKKPPDPDFFLNAREPGPVLAQLQTLALDRCDLDEAGAMHVVAHHAQLAHLRRLSISGERISGEAQAALGARLGNAQTAATRFAITESQVVAAAPDRASLTAARKVAHADKWLVLGYDARRARVWGEYEGSDHYHVYVQFAGAGSCPAANARARNIRASTRSR